MIHALHLTHQCIAFLFLPFKMIDKWSLLLALFLQSLKLHFLCIDEFLQNLLLLYLPLIKNWFYLALLLLYSKLDVIQVFQGFFGNFFWLFYLFDRLFSLKFKLTYHFLLFRQFGFKALVFNLLSEDLLVQSSNLGLSLVKDSIQMAFQSYSSFGSFLTWGFGKFYHFWNLTI